MSSNALTQRNDFIFITFPVDFPVEMYSVAMSTIFTSSNTLCPNHVIIASNDKQFESNPYVQRFKYLNQPNQPVRIQVVLPQIIIDKSILTGTEVLLLPNSSSLNLPAIKGRLSLNKEMVAPSVKSTNFDKNGYLRFINDIVM